MQFEMLRLLAIVYIEPLILGLIFICDADCLVILHAN
jgi:hypothetical protein